MSFLNFLKFNTRELLFILNSLYSSIGKHTQNLSESTTLLTLIMAEQSSLKKVSFKIS